MSIHSCRIRINGCTSLPLAGIFVLSDELLQNATYPIEEWIAKTILKRLPEFGFCSSSYIDHVYSVASLPRSRPEFLTQNALSFAGLNAGHLIELGNNCASILDALALCASFTEPGSNAVIICADAFKSTYKADQENSSWLDGGAALVFGNGDLRLTIESYVTANDHDFSRMCSFTVIDGSPQIVLHPSPNFLEKDLQTEIEVSMEALSSACVQWKDIHGYVIVNRSEERVKKLEQLLDTLEVRLYQSRGYFGHRGGSDLIENLRVAIAANQAKESYRLILVGNGLGYTWSAMVVRLDRVANAKI